MIDFVYKFQNDYRVFSTFEPISATDTFRSAVLFDFLVAITLNKIIKWANRARDLKEKITKVWKAFFSDSGTISLSSEDWLWAWKDTLQTWISKHVDIHTSNAPFVHSSKLPMLWQHKWLSSSLLADDKQMILAGRLKRVVSWHRELKRILF